MLRLCLRRLASAVPIWAIVPTLMSAGQTHSWRPGVDSCPATALRRARWPGSMPRWGWTGRPSLTKVTTRPPATFAAKGPTPERNSRMAELSRAPQPDGSLDETTNYSDKRAPARGGVLPPARVPRRNIEENL